MKFKNMSLDEDADSVEKNRYTGEAVLTDGYDHEQRLYTIFWGKYNVELFKEHIKKCKTVQEAKLAIMGALTNGADKKSKVKLLRKTKEKDIFEVDYREEYDIFARTFELWLYKVN